ncbi:hypothetical protein A6B43_08100 [Vespertiliibacter pulmonis]|uniref:DUF535 domain-containing protein n=1 Tax=Vespertiliibacter pulmonis TaxID=1443036 RepID=A0A3N4W405_9PAST|nr:VirK/YbjX family protein [Vespertiliibacter pulmonis]QLB21485.1 hypothetical protein A6B43_08100 [Vespertiliibacter pulmonis]RPE85901.1 hypothetical protein EDC46_0289 [Vespertiliibacter pulmonis]
MNSIKFATYREMHPVTARRKIDKHIRDYVRYHFRSLVSRSQINQLINYLNQNTQWNDIFKQTPYRFNALLAKYCDNRFNRQQRVEAIIQHFELSSHKMPNTHWQKLIEQQSIVLAQLTDEYSLNLNINKIDPFEGFFSINIQNQEGRSFYDASFTFLKDNNLLIASIQGPNSDDAQEQIKLLTKALHGIRPMYLLVIGFKLLSQEWGTALIGIPHKAHAKYRWNDSSYMLFNYDTFWQENNAKLINGYWRIPLEIERKSLESIASKKRSMYRKRYDMLDKMAENIHIFMQIKS